MGKHILYAYVEGSDLDDISKLLTSSLEGFVKSNSWVNEPIVVNHRHEAAKNHRPDDLPDWELGLNVPLDDVGYEKPGWFADITSIAKFVGELAARTNRVFVIGIYDRQSQVSDDLFYIDGSKPNIAELKVIIGVGEIE